MFEIVDCHVVRHASSNVMITILTDFYDNNESMPSLCKSKFPTQTKASVQILNNDIF